MMPHTPIAMRPASRLARPVVLATALLAPAAWAGPFTVSAGGTVTDAATGLVWDQCHLGQGTAECASASAPATPASQLSWAAALTIVQDMNTQRYKGYADWRLPNVKELLSLRDLGRDMSPALDPLAFPGVVAAPFWSSTTVAATASNAWAVEFAFGATSMLAKTDTLYVRLVRGGRQMTAFDALDTTPPVTTAGPTVLPGGVASVTVDEDATGYWQVLPAGQPAPAPATLMLDGAPIDLVAQVPGSLALGNLVPGADYVLYFIARDVSGNPQTLVAGVAFTAASTPGGAQAVPAASSWILGWLVAAMAWLGWRQARRR